MESQKVINAVAAKNAMSVDVEDYFQVSAFESVIHRADWHSYECRVEANIERILELFSDNGATATFFFLGWVAEQYPSLVRQAVKQGHEIGSHGYQHVRVNTQGETEFREDVIRTKGILEELSGKPVSGYRAASFSIDEDNQWAHDVLARAGHRYSSSIHPIAHDRYGLPDAPRFAFRPSNGGVPELPISTFEFAGRRLPCGGGGYFRLLPYAFSRWGLGRVNREDREPAIFYFHPWEIDPSQPRVPGISARSRFRHYVNLDAFEGKLTRLLQDFQWTSIEHAYAALI